MYLFEKGLIEGTLRKVETYGLPENKNLVLVFWQTTNNSVQCLWIFAVQGPRVQ